MVTRNNVSLKHKISHPVAG